MLSFIIPVLNNLEYTKFTYSNIRSQYPNAEVVIVSKSTDGTDEYFSNLDDSSLIFQTHNLPTLSEAYNLGVSLATKDVIALIHNDMFIGEGFIESILEDLEPNTILTYTRVEPPVFNDTYAGKELMDFGFDLVDFNQEGFKSYCKSSPKEILEGGSQLFFACYKNDYIGLDGDTFTVFCEDDDIHLRYRLGGFNMKVTTKAKVYHLVSKTSRKKDLSHIERESNFNFIKKWGYRNGIQPRYKKKLVLNNSTPQLEELLKPWFDEEGDIIITIDGANFTQQDFNYLKQLPAIIKNSGEIGSFKIGSLHLDINDLTEYQTELIRVI